MQTAETSLEYNYCASPLAAYACRPDHTRGRLVPEKEGDERTAFERDRDRIMHSSAFRRLVDKTQVFVRTEISMSRNRLTHTIEVSQFARSIARALMVNQDLAEAVALAHDLGHPPFAHMGEDRLKELMQNYGGFEHNDQSLRLVTMLERKYPQWNGLNLTFETLEGIVKHNGPVKGRFPHTLDLVQKDWDLRPGTYASIEAQVAGISDDIAYNAHDIEDGVTAGLFTLSEIADAVPLVGMVLKDRKTRYPDLDDEVRLADLVRKMYDRFVLDVLAESRKRIQDAAPKSVEDVRNAGRPLVGFSNGMTEHMKVLRAFLMTRMYMHPQVRGMRETAETVITDLFNGFMKGNDAMPKIWDERVTATADATARARVISDYISGMTDGMALSEHTRILARTSLKV